eukprot:9340341-Alexandrium_andersonii.AAC.1
MTGALYEELLGLVGDARREKTLYRVFPGGLPSPRRFPRRPARRSPEVAKREPRGPLPELRNPRARNPQPELRDPAG